MMRAISLHQLCALELSPWQLVEIAAKTGYQHVCVCTKGPPNPALRFPLVEARKAAAFRRHVVDHGLSVLNVEACFLTPTTEISAFREPLETGYAIGAPSVTVVSLDPDSSRTRENFQAVCSLAGEIGLRANLEFMALSPTVATLADAVAEVRGVENAAVAIDALHLARTGGTAAEIAAIDPELIGYVQLCDGPLHRPKDEWRAEAIGGRQPPGAGEFPLVDLLRAVPPRLAISLEAPMDHRRDVEGMDAPERARLLFESACSIIERAGQ